MFEPTVNPIDVAQAAAALLYPDNARMKKVPGYEVPQEQMNLTDSTCHFEIQDHTIYVRCMENESTGTLAYVYNAVPVDMLQRLRTGR